MQGALDHAIEFAELCSRDTVVGGAFARKFEFVPEAFAGRALESGLCEFDSDPLAVWSGAVVQFSARGIQLKRLSASLEAIDPRGFRNARM
jgi:hypothetical protein